MKKALPLIILCCLGVIIYSNTFQNSFQFDDVPYIVKNLNIRNPADLGAIWHNWPTRFVAFFTLALNYYFHGLDPFGYHLTNIIIHIGSAILVWRLILLTFSTPVVKKDKISSHSSLIALLVALIFLCHPIQTESVTYIYQRFASLAGFLYLLSLTLYVKSRLSEISGDSISKTRFLYILSLSFGIVAMFTKEHAFTLPLMVVLYELCFLMKDRRIQWNKILPFLVILSIIPILLFTTKPPTFVDIERMSEQPVAARYYLLTQLRVMVTYIRLLFIPLNQNLDYDYPVSRSLAEPATLASAILLVAILVFAIRNLSRYRLISFGIFWFFLTLLPESSVVPLGDLIFEHRLYLPSAGYSLFLVSAAYYLIGKRSLRSMTVMLLIVVTFYSILAYSRNFVWRDHFSLWNDAVYRSPGKARPYNNRGAAYNKQGNYDLAFSDFNQAIKLRPDFALPYSNRGSVYARKGNYDQAISDFNQAIKLRPDFAEPYSNRGFAYSNKGNYDLALSDLNQAIRIGPNLSEPYNNRGNVYARKGNYDQAISDFNQAIKLNPNYATAYNNRGAAYNKQGNYDLALLDFNQAIRIQPNFSEHYNNRGFAYLKKGEYDKALADFNQAIKLNPNYAKPYNNRGAAYTVKGNYDLALLDFNQAINIDPNNAEPYINRGAAYTVKGNYGQAISDLNKAINIDPNNAAAYNNRAVAYFSKHEYEKAWEDVRKAEALGKEADPKFLRTLEEASGRQR